ncbi:MAG TPA: hypothetical protein VH684_17950 [Xanthobacteraceae bacterium]|jgi:hypothetical protein
MKFPSPRLIAFAALWTANVFAMPATAMPVSGLTAAMGYVATEIDKVGCACSPYRCCQGPRYFAPPGIYYSYGPGWYGQGQGWAGTWNGMALYGGWYRGRWYGGWYTPGSWSYRRGW